MFSLFELIPDVPTIKIIDVGAMSLGQGTECYAPLMAAKRAKIVGFEPIGEECDRLNAAGGADYLYLPYAVGDGRMGTFHVGAAPMTSSLYEVNTELVALFQNLEGLMRVKQRVPIQTHRLDDLEAVRGADFLKLDIQGAELDVLNGATQTLIDVVCVQTEVEFVPLYKNQPLFAEVDQKLRGAGFLLHRMMPPSGRTFLPLVVNNNVNATMSQMLWSDAVYVRDFTRLDQLSPEKLLKLAAILHSVYGSVDLAALALRHYDAKAGTTWDGQYLQRLCAGG